MHGTLTPGDYDYAIYDLKPPCKISSLTAMLICPVIAIFYINFISNYDLKMSKIVRQLTFLNHTKGFLYNDVLGIPLTKWPPGLKSLKIQPNKDQTRV